jgi:unsaturated rhamnogalacturonyl hydrolase
LEITGKTGSQNTDLMKSFVVVCLLGLLGVSSTAQPVVLLDAYFNNETKKDPNGKDIHWHYAWEDFSDGGFALFAKVFQNKGASLKTITTAPTANDLSKVSIYIIVDPDHLKDNPFPHYMNSTDASTIAKWVKKGGVLLMMANDSLNCDLDYINILAEKFGIAFSKESINMVKGKNYEMGNVYPIKGNNIFSEDTKIFMKDVSALSISKKVIPIANNGDKNIIAYTRYGKGHVIAVGDPWLYNEYIDSRKLPTTFQNTKAAEQLADALIKFSQHN